MPIRLPSRYEDLDTAFRGRLKPNKSLLAMTKQAFYSMEISGGIRFLPVYGQSGSGKTSAALEIGTHIPELYVEQIPRSAVEDASTLRSTLSAMIRNGGGRGLVAVIDQYEEVAAQRTAIPSTFVETLSLLDRDQENNNRILFIWLTTSREFQSALATATSRNKRILVNPSFEIASIEKAEWPAIIQETFQFHNQDKALSDYEILEMDLVKTCEETDTIGAAIEDLGINLAQYATTLHDLSDYLVVMLWPVTDGLRISRVQQFTDPRQGYKIDWNAWYRQLNSDDQNSLPLREYNKARLYFDMRLIPIAAADLQSLCKNLDDDSFLPKKSYTGRLINTHFYSIISGNWSPETYAPLRERESQRAENARAWYPTVTQRPTAIGKRLAKCISSIGMQAVHEEAITSRYGSLRADILINRSAQSPSKVIVELKAYNAENTMPSTIAAAIQTTFRRHAQFAGFLQRQ